ncbi:fumarylacetoacetate hydrolase family protein [Pseudomaricurvus alkylphenolicus]|uniref:fumarylacetoacetate hydrolase family protein n=1 Tax=Pseudomaricurvus alkylphenolicus TaxID=1306991 RepID=UPI00141D9E30|nr:fumarylacetoacetate hydrolase family protein [Pseudomaricurvus alkylphenolicus]NIB43394.1 fumarylacetoacetate hydrolase family protein [Pseudomaricurvus alkylphenolicus]
MKLVRFIADNGPRTGVVVAAGENANGGIVDLLQAKAEYTDIMEIINAGQPALESLNSAAADCPPHYRLEDVTLLAPIVKPGKFLAIGMNYKKHQQEAARLGVQEQTKQVWFNKQTSCITGPYADIDPGVTEKLDYEVELGVVIGKPAKGVSKEHAREHIFGYFVVNDVSARDWQFHTPTFTMGKSFDTHGPMGPWIVTADEIDDPQNLGLRCIVNGEVRQSNNTSQMVHDIDSQIEYLSTAFTLESGDLIATGTPEGVGVAMEPAVFLQPGDVVRCEIDAIGAIENKVKI